MKAINLTRNQCVASIVFLLTFTLSSASECQNILFTPISAPPKIADKDAPTGWSRYEFTYDGGDNLSVLLPDAPVSGFLIGAPPNLDIMSFSGLELKVTEHHFTTHLGGANFIISYFSSLSIPTEQFSEREKKLFCPLTFGKVFALDKKFETGIPGWEWVNRIGEPKAITIGDREGFEQDLITGYRSSPFHLHARAILQGRYAYIVMAGDKEGLSEEQYTPFLNSFQLLKK